jgi:hypothetical protein
MNMAPKHKYKGSPAMREYWRNQKREEQKKKDEKK